MGLCLSCNRISCFRCHTTRVCSKYPVKAVLSTTTFRQSALSLTYKPFHSNVVSPL